jgi:homoserine kinase
MVSAEELKTPTSRQILRVQVPASSANIGPGFDVLGMALSVYAHLEVDLSFAPGGDSSAQSGRVDETHPAMVAFRSAGGRGSLRVQSAIPSGRGLGFSGAVRVGGVCLGLAEAEGVSSAELSTFIAERHQSILNLSGELEGHSDNVAASLYGGVTAVFPDERDKLLAIGVPLSPLLISECVVAVWVPSFKTSTAKSRQTLSPAIDRADAIFNIAHAIRLTIAFSGLESSGRPRSDLDITGLRSTFGDRLHQEPRLQAVPLSRKALDTMINAGAITGWLSGSGPTVAALCRTTQVREIERALAADDVLRENGRLLSLKIDENGLQAAR